MWVNSPSKTAQPEELSGREQAPQEVDVHGVKIDTCSVVDPFRGFEDQRHRCKAWVVDEMTKRLQADFATSDAGMPVNPTPSFTNTIVDMPDLDAVDSDRTIQFLNGCIVLCKCLEPIPRRENMTGVHADSEPIGLFHSINNGAEMLEAVAQARPLSGGRFERDPGPDVGGAAVDLVDGLGDPGQADVVPKLEP